MENLSLLDSLRLVTKQELPYSRLCVVRRNSNTHNFSEDILAGKHIDLSKGDSIDLLYEVEPIDSPDFDENPAYEIVDGVLKQTMSDEDLALSMQSWISYVRLSAQSEIETAKLDADDSTGVFFQPEINSYVIVSFLDSKDAYITMISKTGNIKIKGNAGEVDFTVDDFAEANKNLIQFSKSDIFRVLTNTPDVEFLIQNIIKLINGNNYIEIGSNKIDMQGLESPISIRQYVFERNKPIGELKLNADGKFTLESNDNNYKVDFLDNLFKSVNALTDAVADINTKLSTAATATGDKLVYTPVNPLTITDMKKGKTDFGNAAEIMFK